MKTNITDLSNGSNKTPRAIAGAALISASFIALEILWTRIFSAEYFYTFAFLILSLSILGLGLGALTVRLSRRLSSKKHLWLYLSLGGIISIAGPVSVLQFDLNFTELFGSGLMAGKVFLVIVILSLSFLFGGMALSIIFKNNHENMPKVYMADLIGAGLGVIFAVILMNTIQVQKTAFLVSVPSLLAAIIYAPRYFKIVPAIVIIAIFIGLPKAETWLEKEREERFELIYKHWDAMAQLKILKVQDDFYYAVIENAAHSPTPAFDGDFDKPDSLKEFPGYPMLNIVKNYDSCTFMALGAGGGGDVLNALNSGATEVHAVEVVPHLNDLLVDGFLNEFNSRMYNDSRVKVITEDARAYVRRFENKFDIIYSLSSNTFASLASGAFALAENYLFTLEAFEDYYDAMTDNGIMLMDHQFYIPRLTNVALQALRNKGVMNPKKHLAVFHSPQGRRMMMLYSKQPMDSSYIASAFPELTSGSTPYLVEQYPNPVDSLKYNSVAQIINNGWEKMQDSTATDLSPNRDNRPFAAQLGLWKNFDITKLDKISPYEFMGFPLAKLLIITILIFVFILIIPINLLPFFKKGEKLTFKGWGYFFLIGAAFMAVEVILIQKYTCFIGPGSYTFVTILFTLLLASGIGSRLSKNFRQTTPFLAIFIWILFDVFFFEHLFDIFAQFNVVVRIIVSSILIFPLGFFMGMPFPIGTGKVGKLIDWGFAVNGAASVLGSTAIMLVAFNFGYNQSLFIGGIGYLLALLLVLSKKKWIKSE